MHEHKQVNVITENGGDTHHAHGCNQQALHGVQRHASRPRMQSASFARSAATRITPTDAISKLCTECSDTHHAHGCNQQALHGVQQTHPKKTNMKSAAVMREPLAAGDSMPSMANPVKHIQRHIIPCTACKKVKV